jgi:hypothetical protein
MFGLRDELFDFGVRGELAFSHPAYQLLRTTMNGFIRYGHRLSIIQVALIAMTRKRSLTQPSFIDQWEVALRECPPEVRVKLLGLRRRMNIFVAIHMIRVSPLALLLLFALLPSSILGLLISQAFSRIKVSSRRWMTNEMDSTALAIGASKELASACA